MNYLIYSLINLAIAVFFIMLGIVSVMLPWSPVVRTDLIQFILEDSIAIFIFGFCLIFIGLAVVINITFSARLSYYHLRSGPKSVWIEESVIQDYINSYWKDLFPQSSVPNRVTMKKNKIHLVADLPYIPLHEQKQLLEKIKNDLAEIFGNFLGYREPFYLSASFQPEGKQRISDER